MTHHRSAPKKSACDCATAPSLSSRLPSRARASGSWLALLAGLAATLAPKCPLCLAAYLSMLGMGVGLAKVAPWLLPLGVVVMTAALVAIARARLTRRRAA